jgi:histidine phosphotransferase ChpT
MSGTPIEALDLAALLCSRVCHDLISPVGAIINGLEVLAEEKDEETKTFALDLIKKSAGIASAKLQFCRIAFGAAGSSGAQIDLGDAETVSRGFFEDDKTKLVWNLPRALLPKNRVKLLLNLLLIAGQTIPRGGRLTVDPIGAGESMGFKVSAAGANAKVPPAVAALLSGETGDMPLDAHRIQPFYASLLAQAACVKVAMVMEGEAVAVSAQ